MKKIISATDHPQFDLKEFEIQAKALKSWSTFFTGQPAALVKALRSLVGTKQSRRVTGRELRTYLERHREDLFPGCEQKDILRVFQGYHSQLERAGIVAQV